VIRLRVDEVPALSGMSHGLAASPAAEQLVGAILGFNLSPESLLNHGEV